MRRLLPVVLLLIAMPEEVEAVNLASSMREWVAVEQEAAQVPGVIAAIVSADEVVMAEGFGWADVGARRAADASTRFRVGSVSKPVTATGALLAMIEFDVAPGDDVSGYLEALPIDPPLAEPLTLHHLLTHTAGFSESLSAQHVRDPADLEPLSQYLLRRLPPRFERPGVLITYNDHHTALAGYVVEQLSGSPFPAFMSAHLFEPLGMSRSTFDQLTIARSDMARSYRLVDTNLEPYEPDLILATPGAGLATTADDMARYLRYLLAEPPPHPAQLRVQFSVDARLPGRSYGFAESSHGGELVLYKDGQANGFGARLLMLPSQRLGVFVAVNRSVLGPLGRSNAAGRFLRGFTAEVLDRVVPRAADAQVSPPAFSPAPADAHWAGHYRTTIAARHSWEKMLAMLDGAKVAAVDGGLRIGSSLYTSVGRDVYRHENRLIGFVEGSMGRYLVFGSGSYEQVPWYGSMQGTIALLSVCLLGGVLAILMAVLRRPRGYGLLAAGGGLRIAAVVVLGAGLLLADPQVLFYGMPMPVAVACGLALAAVAADSGALLQLLRTPQPASPIQRVLAVTYGATTALFAAWLYYWNLLGWQI